MVMALLFSVRVFADPLATLDSESGPLNIVGYTTTKDDGKDVFVVLYEYTNTSDDSKSPDMEFIDRAYQDGIELERHYSDFEYKDFKPCDTRVRPGSTLKYYNLFEMSGKSPVDVEVEGFLTFDSSRAEYTFDISKDMPSDSDSDVDDEWKTKYEKMEQKYEKLDAEYEKLEKKYDKLEKKYKKLKKKTKEG